MNNNLGFIIKNKCWLMVKIEEYKLKNKYINRIVIFKCFFINI